jgi:hypothetical protein
MDDHDRLSERRLGGDFYVNLIGDEGRVQVVEGVAYYHDRLGMLHVRRAVNMKHLFEITP